MFFLINYILAYLSIKLGEFYQRQNIYGANQFNIIVFIFFAIPCALQYKVGTDYDGYIEIIENNNVHFELLIDKREILFAILTKIVYLIGPGYEHLIFIAVAFLYATILIKILNTLEKQGYKKSLIFIIIWLTTGLMHNQLSALRNFLAVYIVIYSVLNIQRLSLPKFLTAIAIASLFHQTALFFSFFYIIKKIDWRKNNTKKLMIFSFVLFGTGLPLYALELGVDFIVPEYSRYIVGEAVASENDLNILNILTKIVYLPVYIYIVYFVKNRFYEELNENRKMWLSISLALSFAWALIPYGGFFFRFYHYVVFFQIFSIYEAINYAKRTDIIAYLAVWCIIIFPYLIKVLAFPSNEYLYNSIIQKWLF